MGRLAALKPSQKVSEIHTFVFKLYYVTFVDRAAVVHHEIY